MAKPGRPKKVKSDNEVVENVNEDIKVEKEDNSEMLKGIEAVKPKPEKDVELDDNDEIEVVSLIPNVSYTDTNTGDTYEWENEGDTQLITVRTLKNIWRSFKGYFRNLWIKPMDERVIEKFGLTRLYSEYDILTNKDSYTKDGIDDILKILDKSTMEIKYTVINIIKDFVSKDEISDISVLRRLGKKLDTDFI